MRREIVRREAMREIAQQGPQPAGIDAGAFHHRAHDFIGQQFVERRFSDHSVHSHRKSPRGPSSRRRCRATLAELWQLPVILRNRARACVALLLFLGRVADPLRIDRLFR
jgi:hypothetical protein